MTRLNTMLPSRCPARPRVAPYVFGLAALLMTMAAQVHAAPVVVELYTSEGCSSCPPAEALLQQLSKRAEVLPLAFHVDYWDSPEWRDRFSLAQASARQQFMARLLHLSPVGTPQFIVAGRRAVWGANGLALEAALSQSAPQLEIDAARTGDELHVKTAHSARQTPFDVYVVGFLSQATTVVKGGENKGRTLGEINVVRTIRKIGSSSDAARDWRLSLAGLPNDVEHFAILLQSPSSGAILGAQLVP